MIFYKSAKSRIPIFASNNFHYMTLFQLNLLAQLFIVCPHLVYFSLKIGKKNTKQSLMQIYMGFIFVLCKKCANKIRHNQ